MYILPYFGTEAKTAERRQKNIMIKVQPKEVIFLRVGQNVWFKKLPDSELWSKGTREEDEGNSSYSLRTPNGALLRRNDRFTNPMSPAQVHSLNCY